MLWQEWSKQGLNAVGKLVADIIVETLQNAGVKHCYGVVDEPTLLNFAEAIGSAHSPLFYHRRRHACGFAVHRRLVPANAPGEVR